MEDNRVELYVPEDASIVAGPGPGREAYKSCKKKIDIDNRNIISFPNHVTRIIGSFFTGFFEELSKSMTSGEIREHFDFDSTMPSYESAKQAFEKYIMNNK